MVLTGSRSRRTRAALAALAAAVSVAAYWLLSGAGLLFAALIVWLFASVVGQAVFAFASRKRSRPAGNAWLFRTVSAAYFLLLGAASWAGTVYRDFNPAELRGVLFELAAVVALALVGTVCERVPHAWPTRLWSRAALAVLLAVDLVRAYTPPAPVVRLALPFESAFVVHGGEGDLVNHHFRMPAQRYAVDLVLPQHVGGAEVRSLDGYPCYGVPVLAGASGQVRRVVGDRPDEPLGSSDVTNPFGNYVVLELDGAPLYTVYAHLRRGSVKVVEGQHVHRGEPIGACGNSGNTSEPHLHMQVHATPFVAVEDESARSLPFAFDAALRASGKSIHRVPRRNDILLARRGAP